MSQKQKAEVPSFQLQLLKEKNKEARIEAHKSLAQFDSDGMYKRYMIAALKDRSDDVKIVALTYFADHHATDDGEILESYLIPLMNNNKSRVRHWVVRALERYRNEKATKALLDNFKTSDTLLQFRILDALIKIGDPSTADKLFMFAKHHYKNHYFGTNIPGNYFLAVLGFLISLNDVKIFTKMEKTLISAFSENPKNATELFCRYPELFLFNFQLLICNAMGRRKMGRRFFDIIINRVKSESNYEKAVAVLMLMELVDIESGINLAIKCMVPSGFGHVCYSEEVKPYLIIFGEHENEFLSYRNEVTEILTDLISSGKHATDEEEHEKRLLTDSCHRFLEDDYFVPWLNHKVYQWLETNTP